MDADQSREKAGQERLARLRELAQSLERAQAALLARDLSGIRRQTALQYELCMRLRQPRGNPAQSRTSPQLPMGNGDGASERDLAEAARTVSRLNRNYAALLRRSLRTVDIFCRVLATSALTYPPPRPEAASFAAGFQE